MSSDWFARAFDGVAAEFGRMVTDVRQRVVEEGTYGKIVTPRVSSITVNAPGEKSPGEGLGWFDRNFDPEPVRQQDSGRDIHGNERAPEHVRER